MSDRLVSDLMTETVHTVTPDSNLADLFDRHDVRHVPVVDGGSRLVGIVTQSDFLRVFADGEA